MRLERVEAHAFGPLRGEVLELAPGLNVVTGPNEAGKSSWHAACTAALSGQRRAKGRARQDDADFARRHRPWRGEEWAVGARLVLADGQALDVHHDLDARTGELHDAATGRSLTASAQHDGGLDPSRLTGLDRRALTATASVRQADLLLAADDASAVRTHLQRVASVLGGATTAAEALARIGDFRREQVGSARTNSQRPLMTAVRAEEAARRVLAEARSHQADHQRSAAAVEELRLAVQEAEQRLASARLRRLLDDEEALARELGERRLEAAHFADGPPPAIAEADELDELVADVRAAWRSRPEPPAARAGTDLEELRRKLTACPPPPAGPTVVPERVRTAVDGARRAHDVVVGHDEDRPSDPPPLARPRHRGPTAGALVSLLLAATGLFTGLPLLAAAGGAGALVLLLVAARLRQQSDREAVAVEAAVARRASWDERRRILLSARAGAVAALDAALAEAGVEGSGSQADRLDRLHDAVRTAATQAVEASRRPELEAALALAEQEAAGARRAAEQREEAERDLLHALAAIGAAAEVGGEEADHRLGEWVAGRRRQRSRAAEERDRWRDHQRRIAEHPDADLDAALAAAVAEREELEAAGIVAAGAGASEERAAAEVRDLDRRLAEGMGELEGRRQSVRPVAEAEEELHEARRQLERLQRLDQTLERTAEYLAAAQERAHRSVAPALAGLVGPQLARVTGGRYDDVRIDPEELVVRVAAGPELIDADRLSRGTCEQIHLLLRIALADVLVTPGESLPLLLDEVTVHADPRRTEAMLELLLDVAAERQVVVFTQEPDVVDWARSRLVDGRDRLVVLDGVSVRA